MMILELGTDKTVLVSNQLCMTDKKKVVVHYRDAEDGQYVTKEYAEKHPDTTVKEKDKK